MTNVFESSQKLVVEDTKEKAFSSPKNTEDLTKIKGIGPGTALKLNKAGIYSFKQLAKVSPDILSEIPGINLTSAQKFITGAKNLLGEFLDQSSLDDQVEVLETVTEIVKEGKVSEKDDIETFEVAEIIVDEELPQEEFEYKEEKIERTQEPWFDNKFNHSRLTGLYPPILEKSIEDVQLEIEEIREQTQEKNENVFNEEYYTFEKPDLDDFHEQASDVPDLSEILEVESIPKISNIRDEREKTRSEIEKSIKISGYYLIPNTINTLKPFMEHVDYIGCKLVQVSNWVNHIFLIPIKVCDLKGTVLVNEIKLDFKPGTVDSKTESMSRLRHYNKNLLYTRDLMFDDIVNEGSFREFFQKYLQISLTLEKSVGNKKLFFKSGQIQYKVLIEPMLLCKTPPRCMEKSISFPYQRSTNIHIIHQPNITQLLSFIEQKYRLIESRVKSSTTIKNFQKMDDKFRTNVRFVSIPLVVYAIALGVVYFAEFFFVLRLLNSIGFALVGIYLSILAYLYFKFYRTKKALAIEFETPYYMQNLEFSEIDLLEFKDEFTPEYLAQFGYECFGKNRSFKVLEQIEKDSYVTNVEIKHSEPESLTTCESKESLDEEAIIHKTEYSNKYISFLDD